MHTAYAASSGGFIHYKCLHIPDVYYQGSPKMNGGISMYLIHLVGVLGTLRIRHTSSASNSVPCFGAHRIFLFVFPEIVQHADSTYDTGTMFSLFAGQGPFTIGLRVPRLRNS
jgi:hypothetical protein